MKKRVLALILTFSMVFTMLNTAFAAGTKGTLSRSGNAPLPAVYAARASDFTDLPDDWSRGAIERAIENGLLSGANGKINAGAQLTRAELAAIVVRAFGTTETASLSGFSDVNPSDWYYDALQKAVAMGILSGNNGKLNPNAPITREEVCAVLHRAFLLQDGGNAAQKFGDAGQISDWARAAVAAMAAKGYIAGDSAGNVNGSKTITRAEFAQMMDNLVKGYPSGAQGGVIEGNAVMKAGQSLSGMTIRGDLILADGLGRNDVDLSNCTVEGRIIVRGGSEVKFSGTTSANGGVVVAVSSKLNNTAGSRLSSVSVVSDSITVTLAGAVGRVEVQADDVTIRAESDAKIDTVETAASGTTVEGSGEVAAVEVKSGASDTRVTTNHTDITVENGGGTVTSNNGSLSGGQTGTTDSQGALKADSKPQSTQSPSSDKTSGSSGSSGNRRPNFGGGSSSGSSGSSTVTRYDVTDESGRQIGRFERGTILTVNLNGGGESYTITVNGDRQLKTPARDGYTFAGWSVSGTTVTAQWTENGSDPEMIEVRDSEGRPIGAYVAGTQLTVDPANGKDEPYLFTVGTDNNVITVPTREGYLFNRWLPIDHTVTADWREIPSEMTEVKRDDGQPIGNFEVGVTLTVDPNNGTDEPYTVTVEPGLVIKTPEKAGFYFVNWYRDPLTTLTAQWSETPVEMGEVVGSEGRFIANHPIGTVLTVEPDNGEEPYTVTVEKRTVIQRPVKEGYDFDRWEPVGTTIKALWIKKAAVMTEIRCSDGHFVGNFEVGVTLTIDPANGTDQPYTAVVKPGLIIQHPTREGYTFKEWGRNPLTTLTAVWEKDEVDSVDVKDSEGRKIGTFKIGDVLTVDYDNGTAKETVTVAKDTVITVPEKEGFTFKEWKVIDKNVTAVWTENEPVVTDATMIYNGEQAAPIVMDASYAEGSEHVYTQIARAVGDLRQDIAMVNGAIDYKTVQQLFDDDSDKQAARLAAADEKKVPQLSTDISSVTADYAILVGSARDSQMIKDLIAAGKLTGAGTINAADAWEAYTIEEVDNPTENIKKALVIAGADARGTIFGIYTISEEIGVSPWYWFSDVPVKTKTKIDVDYTTALTVGNPDVKFRGIFINDEENTLIWQAEKYKFEKQRQPGVNYYRRLFEVILRMKGNALWPAMHSGSAPFFGDKNENGDSINGIEAGKYGIVMGSSHCEILLRNSNTEWWPWIGEYNKRPGVNNTVSNYNFCINKDAMLQYWRERLEEAKRNGIDAVMVLGLRGTHDGEAEYTSGHYANRTEMMKDVIKEQRKLIKEVYGDEKAVAQVYVAYDDLGERYNDGVNQLLAQPEYEDIIVMWANDSYGHLRQTPNDTEKKRKGGSGIYYHTSYMGWNGDRKSWLFLNSLPIQQMNEQMHRAYDGGMKDYWILNVGDLKPGDLLANYFLDMGWDMEKTGEGQYSGHPATEIHQYLVDWCVKQYAMDNTDAEAVASAMEEFYDLTNAKKIEFYGVQNGDPPFDGAYAHPFSVVAAGDEGQRIAKRANDMVDAMTVAYEKMDADTKSAFFEQMYFLAQAYCDVVEEYVYYWKNLEAVNQGRASSAQIYKEMSQKALSHLWEKVNEFWTLNNGKWNKVISPEHKYSQNQGIVMLNQGHYRTAAESEGVGAYAENNNRGTLCFNSLSDDIRYIDVFTKGHAAEAWSMDAPEWVKLSKTSGTVASEERITVTIDWTKTSADTNTGDITVKDSDGTAVKTIPVEAVDKRNFDYDGKKGYVEANGYVMIEAEHYSENTPGSDGSQWYLVHDRGPRGDAMKVSDDLPELNTDTGTGAKLTYNVYFEKAGKCWLTYYRLFTLNEGTKNGVTNACRTMISVNGSNVGLLKGTATFRSGNWWHSIHTSNEPLTTAINVKQGWNTIEVIRSSPSIVFDSILIIHDGDAGQFEQSLLGPEVSPNNIMTDEEYAAARYGVAELPAEISEVEPQLQLKDFIDLTRAEGQSLNVGVHADVLYGDANDKATVKVSSSDTKVVTAAYKADTKQIALSFIKEGKATITVKAEYDGQSVEKSFTVTVVSAEEAAKAYQPNDDGNIIINAADAKDNKPYATIQDGTAGSDAYHWVEVAEGNNKSMQVQKVGDNPTSLKDGVTTGTPWQNAGDWTSAPQMTYKVQVPNAGDYYLNIYSYAWNDQTDSFNFVLNGEHKFRAGKDEGYFDGEGSWGSLNGDKWWCGTDKAKIHLNAGENTVTIAGRKSGYVVRQIMLTPTKQNSLSGWQMTAGATASETEKEKLYLQKADGTIVINAADALDSGNPTSLVSNKNGVEQSSDKTFSWKKVTEGDHFSAQVQADNDTASGLQSGVTTGTPWNDTGTWTNAPQMTYKVYLPADGKYYLNVYSYSWNDQTDSFHFILNGQHQFRAGKDTGKFTNEKNQYGSINGDEWFYGNVQLDLKAGENTITIAGRKSGFVLRQIMLSPKKQSALTGWVETSKVGAADEADIFSLRRSVEIELAEMKDVEMSVGSTESVRPELTGDTDIPYIVKVTSSDEETVSAEWSEDDGITLTGKAAGTAKITVQVLTDDDNGDRLAKQTFAVTVTEAEDFKADDEPETDGTPKADDQSEANDKPDVDNMPKAGNETSEQGSPLAQGTADEVRSPIDGSEESLNP